MLAGIGWSISYKILCVSWGYQLHKSLLYHGCNDINNNENNNNKNNNAKEEEEMIEKVVKLEINSDNKDANEDNKSLVPITAFTEGAMISQLVNLQSLTLHWRTNIHVAIKPPPNTHFIPCKEHLMTNSINLLLSLSSSSHTTSKGKAKRTLMHPTAATTVWWEKWNLHSSFLNFSGLLHRNLFAMDYLKDHNVSLLCYHILL